MQTETEPKSYTPYFGAIMNIDGEFVDLDFSQNEGATNTCQTITSEHHSIIKVSAKSQIDKFISETNELGIPMDPRDNTFYD